jgi:hypothetical protein
VAADTTILYGISLTYASGISFTRYDDSTYDSIKKIFIEGDTMTAVRNLLVYCLQVKEESDYGSILLDMINLDELKKIFKSRDFNFYLSEYRKVLIKNKGRQKKFYPHAILK